MAKAQRASGKKAVVKGIPVELIEFDEDTGEICIGDDCFRVLYEPKRNQVAIEVDPQSQTCNPKMRRAAKKFLKSVIDGRPKVKVRERVSLDNGDGSGEEE
jgi:hypothetical protein